MARTVIVALGADCIAEVVPFSDPARARAFFIACVVTNAEAGGVLDPESQKPISGRELGDKIHSLFPQELVNEPAEGIWSDEALDLLTAIASANFCFEGEKGVQLAASREGIDVLPYPDEIRDEEVWGVVVDTTKLRDCEKFKYTAA